MDRENDDQPTGWRSIYSNERDSRNRPADSESAEGSGKSSFEEEEIPSAETAVRAEPVGDSANEGSKAGTEETEIGIDEGDTKRVPSPDVGHPREFPAPVPPEGRRKRESAPDDQAEKEKEKKAAPARRRKKGHPVLWSFLIAVGIVIAAVGSVLFYVWNGLRPAKSADAPVRVTIEKGMGAKSVAEELEKDGIIRNAFLFGMWMKLSDEGSKFQAGDYDMRPGLTRDEIVEMLNTGKTVAADTVHFTIPEGFTADQIADRLATAGYVDKTAFLQALSKPEQITGSSWTKDIPKNSKLKYPLEGYLFPETYELKKGSTVTDILNRMASELDVKLNQLPDDWQTTMQDRGLTMHEVLTIASLVEREVVLDEERPIVASVIENRLDKKMPLQIDATVQYALGKQKEKLTNDDLKVESPYNTYLHAGLPPGPIASPGIKSIEAAIYPADTDYLYYVTKKDGTNQHLFASTYKQHQKNIQTSEQNEKKQQGQKK
ncbi:endolytic transglycosylase MltG [Cohnella zeiphila]|uniref:Endolytic murein transglycosylase n=1 Tax=Cohnella zeiphila TaxID=2761120 RepID=A0A7X0SV16_9BACL|nr:endolytic transglycosylase MltG [Cohnella zeiphila]MBB6735435.1 endolytic transglycosylase MltG [Cohnella zeiphila]